MNAPNLVDETRARLAKQKRPASLRKISERAKVDYDWLVKFTHGYIQEPGYTRLESVRVTLDKYDHEEALRQAS